MAAGVSTRDRSLCVGGQREHCRVCRVGVRVLASAKKHEVSGDFPVPAHDSGWERVHRYERCVSCVATCGVGLPACLLCDVYPLRLPEHPSVVRCFMQCHALSLLVLSCNDGSDSGSTGWNQTACGPCRYRLFRCAVDFFRRGTGLLFNSLGDDLSHINVFLLFSALMMVTTLGYTVLACRYVEPDASVVDAESFDDAMPVVSIAPGTRTP